MLSEFSICVSRNAYLCYEMQLFKDINADVQVDGNGFNANDSLMIQQYLANIIENL